MKYVEKLLSQSEYISILDELRFAEADRFYCKHGLSHLLNTARIMWIYCLEQELGIEKEMIYLTALLHDIGRVNEFKYKIPHADGSIILAESFLRQIGYDTEKSETILKAIKTHNGHIKNEKIKDLSLLLKYADKLSRNCFSCVAKSVCNWDKEKQNKTIYY